MLEPSRAILHGATCNGSVWNSQLDDEKSCTYQRSTKNSDTAREDELGRLAIRRLVFSCSFKHISRRIDVDLHAEVKIVLGASGHNAVEAVDDGRGTKLGVKDRLDSGRLAQIGLESHVVILGDSFGSFGFDCKMVFSIVNVNESF